MVTFNQLSQRRYVQKEIGRFKDYLKREISVLEGPCLSGTINQEAMALTIRRIEMVIEVKVGQKLLIGPHSERVSLGDWAQSSSTLTDVVAGMTDVLTTYAEIYGPECGSYWSTFGEELKRLAERTRNLA